MTRKAFIIGAGQIATAVAKRLLAEDWQVVLASRHARPVTAFSHSGLTCVALDRDQDQAIARLLRTGADAVIDTVAYDRHHADQLLTVQGDLGAIMVVSSAAVYSDDSGRSLDTAVQSGFPDLPCPIREDQATVAPGPQTYSTRKIALEQRLIGSASVPLTILRPGAIYGIGSRHPREWWFVKRMLDERARIPLAYRGASRFHPTAATNIAAVVSAALSAPGSHVLNVADPSAPTAAEIGAIIAAVLDYRGEIVPLDIGDAYEQAEVGLTPWSVPGNFVLDTSTATALGYQPATDYPAGARQLIAWLRGLDPARWQEHFPVMAAYPEPAFNYAAEDHYWERQVKS
jgi:nucleoside-diphosphate-sugar epimerase